MLDDEIWAAVGTELRAIRERAGWKSTNAMVRDRGRPDQKTMDAIERGRPGQTAKIGEYCAALGVTLADVLAAVLPRAAASAEALRVARQYDALPASAQLAVRLLLNAGASLSASTERPVRRASTPAESGRASARPQPRNVAAPPDRRK